MSAKSKGKGKNKGADKPFIVTDNKPVLTPPVTSEPESNPVDNSGADEIMEQVLDQPETAQEAAEPGAVQTLKLTRSTSDRKDKRLVIYNIAGRTGSVQFLSTLFGGDQESQGNPPDELTLTGIFAEPRKAKAKMTKEERKAALKAETPADKLARAEARVQKLREKIAKREAEAAATAAASAPASGDQPSA